MTSTNERTSSETALELTSILVRNCGLDPELARGAPGSSLAELGLDSLALLELQAVVADRYQVRIPEETARQLSINELAELVDHGGSLPEPPGHTENSVVIAAPLPLVWRLTNDVAHWPELFTEYASAQILERDGETVRFRLTTFPDENGTAWSWVSERTTDPVRHEVHARRVEPGPFEYMRIHWRYEELPEGTRMTWIQDFAMRPTAPVNNAQMVARINTATKEQMAVIRDRIERIAGTRDARRDGSGS